MAQKGPPPHPRFARGALAFGLILGACHHDVAAPQGNSNWLTATVASVSLVATGDSVQSSLTVTNSGTTTRSVQFAPCTYFGPLSLRAYATGATKPAWDSALDNVGPCFTSIEFVELKPGASHTFLQVNDINEILGDSLAAGSYKLTVSGHYLTPSVTTELANATLTLTKHTVPPSTISFTTDSLVYSATVSSKIPAFTTFYTFAVIARFANNGGDPINLLNLCGPRPSVSIRGAGNNVGDASYDPGENCLVPTPPVVVPPGTARVDTIRFTGPTTTSADGVPFWPLYGQFVIIYRTGPACNTSTFVTTCTNVASNVFAVRLPQ